MALIRSGFVLKDKGPMYSSWLRSRYAYRLLKATKSVAAASVAGLAVAQLQLHPFARTFRATRCDEPADKQRRWGAATMVPAVVGHPEGQALSRSLSPRNEIASQPNPSDSYFPPSHDSTAYTYPSALTAFDHMHAFLSTLIFVSIWSLTILTPLWLSYLLYHRYWMTLTGYLAYWLLSASGNLKFPESDYLRHTFVNGVSKWFGTVTVDQSGDPSLWLRNSKPVMVCYHPHGIFSFGFFILNSHLKDLGFNSVVVGAPFVQYFCPVILTLFDILGFEYVGATRAAVDREMKQGRNICIVVGGFEEATLTRYKEELLYLKDRKGFVKYALRHGYGLVPVYGIGENDLYWNLQMFSKFRVWLSSGKFQIPGVLPWGWSVLPFMPKRAGEFKIVCGKRVELPRIGEPLDADVDKYHSLYVEELRKVYEKHKGERPELVLV